MTEAATDPADDVVKASTTLSACKFIVEIGCIGNSAADTSGNCGIDTCNSVVEAEEDIMGVDRSVVVSTTLSTCIWGKVTVPSVASVGSNSGIIHATEGSDAIFPEIPDNVFGTDAGGMDGKLDKPVEVVEMPIPASPSGAEGLAEHFKSIKLYDIYYISLFLLEDFLHLLFIAL